MYRPGLDALRGVAVLAVMCFHSHLLGLPVLRGGWVGVDVFFVLSGFLITGIVADSTGRPGWVRGFASRRLRRLVPALVVMLLAVGLLVPASDALGWGMLSTLLYVPNWTVVAGVPFAPELRHAWSLGVEAQFYLLWPLVLACLASWDRPRLCRFTLGLAALVTLWRLGNVGAENLYVRTDMRSDGLLLGAALALAPAGVVERLARWWRHAAAVLAVVALTVAHTGPVAETVGYTTAALCAVSLVAAGQHGSLPTAGWLVNVGLLSYSLYLWHYPLFHLVGNALAWPLSFAAAFASYRLVEVRTRGRRGGTTRPSPSSPSRQMLPAPT